MHVARASERTLHRPGSVTVLHISPSQGPTTLVVLEQVHEPGLGAPTHRHPGAEETITVLAGKAEAWVADDRAGLDAGSTLLVPQGAWHGFVNTGEGPLRIIASIAGPQPLVEYEADPARTIEIGGRDWLGHLS